MKTKILPVFILALAFLCHPLPLHADETAQRTAAAEELLKTMRADEMMSTMLAKQREALTKMMPSFLPKDAPPEAAQKFQDAMPKIMDSVYKQMTWESLKPDFISIYAEVFTTQEIKDLNEFYKSPLGQKLLAKMPEISAKSIQLMQKRMPAIMEEVQKTVKEMVGEEKNGGTPVQPAKE